MQGIFAVIPGKIPNAPKIDIPLNRILVFFFFSEMRGNIRRRLRRNRCRDDGLCRHLFHLADRAFQPDLAEGSAGALPSLLPLCLRWPIGGLRRFDAPAGDERGQGKVEQAIEAKGSNAINHRPHQGMKSKAELFRDAQ